MALKLKELLNARGLVFTRNGVSLNRVILIPRGANDLHISFDPVRRVIIAAWWTRNGIPICPLIKIPGGANDLHFVI